MLTKEGMTKPPVTTSVQPTDNKWRRLNMRKLISFPNLSGCHQNGLTDELSAVGETMRPIIAAMETWGQGYQQAVLAAAELA